MAFTYVDIILSGNRPVGGQGIADVNAPLTANSTRFTWDDYNAYCLAHKAEWDAADAVIQAAADAAAAAAAATAKDVANPNYATLRDQAQAAIASNDTFLAIVSPTNAQTLAQVKLLTQENTKIIRALAQLVVVELNRS